MGAWRTISVALAANTSAYSAGMGKAGADTQKFGRDVDQANRKIDELDAKLGRAREGLGLGIAAGTVATLGLATKAASDLREAQAAANVVFGEGADVIDAYASGAAQAIGLSKKEALDATSVFGNLFTQLGVGQQEAARLSTSLVTLGADFGSFFNEDATRVIEAQTAAFRGEYDALQRYVPTISAATVQQQALIETGKANADQLTAQEKALATYTLMVEGAGAAQGDFARSNGSAATEAKKASAELKNSSAELGQALLPVAAEGAKALGALARGFSLLPGPAQTAAVGVGGLLSATVLLGPKLVEGAQLLKLGATRALEFGRGLNQPTTGLGKLTGAIGVATAALTAYTTTYSLLQDKYKSGIDTSNLQEDLALFGKGQSDGQRILDQYGGSIESLAGKINALGDAYENSGWENFSKGSNTNFGNLHQIKNEIADLDEALALLAKSDPDAAAATYQKWAAALTDAGASVDNIAVAFPKYADQVERAAEANTRLEGAAGGATDQTNAQADASEAAATAIQDQIDAALGLYDAQTRVADAGEQVNNAVIGVADAEQARAAAVAGVAQAEADLAASRQAVGVAEQAVADARGRVVDAERAVVAAQRDAADAAEQVTVRTQELADARRAAAGDSDDMRDALQGVADAEDAVARAQEDSLTAQQRLDDARANYSRTLAGLQRDAEGAADAVIAAEIRIRDAQENARTLGQRERDRVAEAQARLNKVLSDGTATAEEVAAAQKDLADAIAALPDADDRARAELAVRDALRDYAEAQERATDAADEAARVEAAGVEGSDEVVAARDGVAAAADREAEAQGRLEDAVSNVANVQEAANQRVEDAQRDLEDAILARADADQRVIDAKDGLVAAQGEVAKAVDGVRDAQQRVVDQKQAIVDARNEVETAERKVEAAVREVTLAEIDRARLTFESSLKTDDARSSAAKYVIELDKIIAKLGPGDPLRTRLQDLRDDLAAVAGQWTIDVVLGIQTGEIVIGQEISLAAASQALGALASGGPAVAGKAYLVGEKGPELAVFPADGYVYNAAATQQILGSTPTGVAPASAVPQMAPGWAQPSSLSGAIDYKALGEAVAASLPHQGPLVNVEQVNEGVGLDAVFRQAEFASR